MEVTVLDAPGVQVSVQVDVHPFAVMLDGQVVPSGNKHTWSVLGETREERAGRTTTSGSCWLVA